MFWAPRRPGGRGIHPRPHPYGLAARAVGGMMDGYGGTTVGGGTGMFGLFGKKPNASTAPATPRSRRVNLEKRFTIVAETGQGSMSHVYRAVDNQSGRSICLKVQDKEK